MRTKPTLPGCLVVLAFEGPTATTALAVDVGVHQSTVTRATDQLAHRRLAVKQRDDTNRRRTVVALTQQGEALIDSVMSRRQEAILAVLSKMRPADAALAAHALAAFTEQAGITRCDA